MSFQQDAEAHRAMISAQRQEDRVEEHFWLWSLAIGILLTTAILVVMDTGGPVQVASDQSTAAQAIGERFPGPANTQGG